MSTADMSSGMPAGPAGCRAGCIVIAIVALLMAGFVGVIIWQLHALGQI